MPKHPKEESLLKINNFLQGKEEVKVEEETFKKLMFIYSVAMKELVTKVEILKEEFETFYNYELIDHYKYKNKKARKHNEKTRKKRM